MISVTDSEWTVNYVNLSYNRVYKICVLFNFVLGRGCSPGSPHSLLWVRQCRPDIKPCTVVQPTYQRLNQRANGDAKYAADTCLEYHAMIKLRESSEVKYREVSTNCMWVFNFTFRLLYPWERTTVATQQETGRAPVPFWKFWREKSVSFCRNLDPVRPACSLLVTPTKISRSICSKNIYNLKTLSGMYCLLLIYSNEQVWQTPLAGFRV